MQNNSGSPFVGGGGGGAPPPFPNGGGAPPPFPNGGSAPFNLNKQSRDTILLVIDNKLQKGFRLDPINSRRFAEEIEKKALMNSTSLEQYQRKTREYYDSFVATMSSKVNATYVKATKEEAEAFWALHASLQGYIPMLEKLSATQHPEESRKKTANIIRLLKANRGNFPGFAIPVGLSTLQAIHASLPKSFPTTQAPEPVRKAKSADDLLDDFLKDVMPNTKVSQPPAPNPPLAEPIPHPVAHSVRNHQGSTATTTTTTTTPTPSSSSSTSAPPPPPPPVGPVTAVPSINAPPLNTPAVPPSTVLPVGAAAAAGSQASAAVVPQLPPHLFPNPFEVDMVPLLSLAPPRQKLKHAGVPKPVSLFHSPELTLLRERYEIVRDPSFGAEGSGACGVWVSMPMEESLRGADSGMLACRPRVPPLLVVLPRAYPRAPAHLHPSLPGYDVCAFYRSVKDKLQTGLQRASTSRLTLSSLLDIWTQSIDHAITEFV